MGGYHPEWLRAAVQRRGALGVPLRGRYERRQVLGLELAPQELEAVGFRMSAEPTWWCNVE